MLKKRGLNKRAEVETKIYFYIAEIVLVGFVLVFLYVYVSGIANSTLLEKNYFSRDIALLMNTIHAAPGNVDYLYEGNLTGYNFIVNLEKNKVSVYEKEEDANLGNPIKVSYPFMEDKAMQVEYEEVQLVEGEKLGLTKEADTVKTEVEAR